MYPLLIHYCTKIQILRKHSCLVFQPSCQAWKITCCVAFATTTDHDLLHTILFFKRIICSKISSRNIYKICYSSPMITLEITIIIEFEIILNIFWNTLGITNHIIPRISIHTKTIKPTSNSNQLFSRFH